MKNKQYVLWGIVIALSSALAIYAIIIAISLNYGDASGWWQVALGAVGIPILYHELSRLRQAVEKKPALSVGIVNINDYPLSNIRAMNKLPTSVRVGKGYAYFALAVRNSGTIQAKFIKIHLEFLRPEGYEMGLTTVKILDPLGVKNDDFRKDTNFDFIFIGGSDRILYPSDTEIFPFFISTSVLIRKITKETLAIHTHEQPALGDYGFRCTVWADGLESSLQENFTVSVVETIDEEVLQEIREKAIRKNRERADKQMKEIREKFGGEEEFLASEKKVKKMQEDYANGKR